MQNSESIRIPAGGVVLEGDLEIPSGACGLVVFVHGSGSSRHSPRNQLVARAIRGAGAGTLLFDLLTKQEEAADAITAELRFDIGLLTRRLLDVTRHLRSRPDLSGLPVGYFGASTGAAAALGAAAVLGNDIAAVVSRGGRPDLARESLGDVVSPTLLIVGGLDDAVIELNEQAFARLSCVREMKIVSGATHLFEEPGTLDEAARLAAEWFRVHFSANPVTNDRS